MLAKSLWLSFYSHFSRFLAPVFLPGERFTLTYTSNDRRNAQGSEHFNANQFESPRYLTSDLMRKYPYINRFYIKAKYRRGV
jgi:hypothetical protein